MKTLLIVLLIILTISCSSSIPTPTKSPKDQTDIEFQAVQEGIKLHDEGKYQDAIDIYKSILKENPDNVSAMYELSYSYFMNGDYEKSNAIALKGIEYESEILTQFYVMVGNTLDILGKTSEAIKIYNAAIETDSSEYLLYYNLALSLFNSEEYAEAKRNYQKALYYNPNHSSSNLALAKLFMNEGKQIQALLYTCRFLILEPNSYRTAEGLENLENLLYAGVEKENENTINLNMFLHETDESVFNLIEFALKAQNALLLSEKSDDHEITKRIQIFKTILGIIEETEVEYNSETTKYLIPYFKELYKNNYNEVFVYYIHQLADDKVIQSWINSNKEKINNFNNWTNNHTWDY